MTTSKHFYSYHSHIKDILLGQHALYVPVYVHVHACRTWWEHWEITTVSCTHRVSKLDTFSCREFESELTSASSDLAFAVSAWKIMTT